MPCGAGRRWGRAAGPGSPGGEQLLDLRDGLGVVPVVDRVDARVARAGHARPGVVEKHRLPGAGAEPFAYEGVDPRVGLGDPGLVRVHDLVHEVLEAVGRLLPFPGADEAVAQDPGAIARAQPAGVLDQLGVRATHVLAPGVGHELRELLLVQAEAVPESQVHVIEGDGAETAARPDVGQALAYFPRGQPEPGFPPPVDTEVGGDLQHPADVEHHRTDHHGWPTYPTAPGA